MKRGIGSKAADIAVIAGAGGGVIGCGALIVLSLLLGPFSLAYDLNHLLPLAGKVVHIAWYNPAILIAGFILARFTVPVALIVWILVSCGVLA